MPGTYKEKCLFFFTHGGIQGLLIFNQYNSFTALQHYKNQYY
jgi:hypothetical protein